MFSVLFLFCAVVVASALCSVSEAAILSLPLVRARIFVEQNRRNAKDVLYLKERIGLTVASVVIVNNVINIVGCIYIGERVSVQFGDYWLGLASGVVTFIIIIFGEIIPKAVGERFKGPLSLFFAPGLRLLLFLWGPIVKLILKMTHPFGIEGKSAKVTEEEIRMMLKIGRDAGTVEIDEEVLCNRVFKLNDLRAMQIMRPMDQIFSISADKTLVEIKDIIIDSTYSRIAVYDKDPNDVVGIVQQNILLKEIAKGNQSAQVREFMSNPVFVNWFTKADVLLEKFQAYNQHLFIVQDSDGKDVGVVTMEDVLEELFGEIFDEKDARYRKQN